MEKNKMHTTGVVRVSEEVIVTIAQTAACEIEGAAFRQVKTPVISGLIPPVRAKINGETAALKLDILVKDGFNASSVAENVQRSVKSAVQNMTGFTVTKVDVNIAGVCFGEETEAAHSAPAAPAQPENGAQE